MSLLRRRAMMKNEKSIKIPLDNVMGVYVGSNGTLTQNKNTYLAYGFIPVRPDAQYLWTRQSSGSIMWRQSFWNSEKEFLARAHPTNSDASVVIIPPSGTRYIMLGFTKDDIASMEDAIEEFGAMTLEEKI